MRPHHHATECLSRDLESSDPDSRALFVVLAFVSTGFDAIRSSQMRRQLAQPSQRRQLSDGTSDSIVSPKAKRWPLVAAPARKLLAAHSMAL
jgi:hypothetical protein